MGDHEDLPFREEADQPAARPRASSDQPGGRSTEPPAAPAPPSRHATQTEAPAHAAHAGRSSGSPDEPADKHEGEQDKRRLFERVMPEILKRVVERAVESGASRLAEGPENLRHFVQEMKLPKEALHYLYQQIDDTKNGLYRVVAKEIRDVLEQTQFADEITQVLTKLSFEIKTEIRFIPNDASPKRGDGADDEATEGSRKLPKPEVTAQASIKDNRKDAKQKTTTGAPPPNPGRRGREDT